MCVFVCVCVCVCIYIYIYVCQSLSQQAVSEFNHKRTNYVFVCVVLVKYLVLLKFYN